MDLEQLTIFQLYTTRPTPTNAKLSYMDLEQLTIFQLYTTRPTPTNAKLSYIYLEQLTIIQLNTTRPTPTNAKLSYIYLEQLTIFQLNTTRPTAINAKCVKSLILYLPRVVDHILVKHFKTYAYQCQVCQTTFNSPKPWKDHVKLEHFLFKYYLEHF